MKFRISFLNIDDCDMQLGSAYRFDFVLHSEEALAKRLLAIATEYVHPHAKFFNIHVASAKSNDCGYWEDSRDFRIVRNELFPDDITLRYLPYNEYQHSVTRDLLSNLFLSDSDESLDIIIERNILEYKLNEALDRKDWDECRRIHGLLSQLTL